MVTVNLDWYTHPEGASYSLTLGGDPVSADRWPTLVTQLPLTQQSAVPALMGLREDELLTEVEGEALLIPNQVLAQLDSFQVKALGLPRPAPYTVSIDGHGTLDRPDFHFDWSLIDSYGRRVLSPVIEGAFLKVGREIYLLGDPLYSLLHGMERFNEAPPTDMDARFLEWARLKELLPEEAAVDGYLKRIQIVRATGFSLDLRADENDELTFDPLLVYHLPQRRPELSDDLDGESPTEEEGNPRWEPALPPAYHNSFAERFRGFRASRSRYVAGGGWYVVVDPPLRAALEVVRRKQEAPMRERRDFAKNPYSYLREGLHELSHEGNLMFKESDIEDLVENLFVESASYSERVAELGLWQPKVIPWVKKDSTRWLPGEEEGPFNEIGIPIGEKNIRLNPEEIPELLERLGEAIEAGVPDILHNGETIPANESALETLQALKDRLGDPETKEPQPQIPQDGLKSDAIVQVTDKVVLQIKDNLDDLDYAPSVRPHRSIDRDPTRVTSPLKPHQLAGFEWLKAHWKKGSPGVLLADDMGLGKTLQALTFLTWVQDDMSAGVIRKKPFLIVAPTGLLKNWEDEHDKHLFPPGLGYRLRVHGQELRSLRRHPGCRGELDTGSPTLDLQRLREADWALTTFETLRDYQHSFGLIDWGVVIFDEAQKIKTPGTLMTVAAKAIHGEFTVILTGTPVENRLADLWCIMDTAQPGLLKDLKSFSQTYEGENAQHSGAVEHLKALLDEAEPQPPLHPKPMLRRLKSQHLEGLPTKEEYVYHRKMPEVQIDRYNSVIGKARSGEEQQQRGYMLAALHALRTVSLHPYLDDAMPSSDEEFIADSARLQAAFEVLDQIAEQGEKTLIFLESRKLQSVLQGLIQRRYKLASPPLMINGQVSGQNRKARVDDFQSRRGFDVMILSPKAGGVGLTLTAANHVIHLSRWWNPAVEDQCTDRVYRIGQEKPVNVYYPLAVHPDFPESSFDQRLHELLNDKRRLSQALLTPPAGSDEDVRKLYSSTVLSS